MRSPDRPSVEELRGTLPDWAIKDLIRNGTIKIDPLSDDWESKVSSVTVDFHLGSPVKYFKRDGHNVIDTKYSSKEAIEDMMQSVELKPDQPFILKAGKTIIAPTVETLGLPDDILGRLGGKSSLARISVVPYMGAERFDPGWLGHPVLEIGTFLHGYDIVLYGGMAICAFSFERIAWAVENPYRRIGKYAGSNDAKVANLDGMHLR